MAFTWTTSQSSSVPSSSQSFVPSVQSAVNSVSSSVTNFGKDVGSFISDIGKEIDTAVSALENATSNLTDLGNIAESWLKSLDFEQLDYSPPFQNVLHSYASYNYIFTLSCIDDFSLNFPNETYKQGDVGQIILKSGSTDSNNRVVIEGFGAFEFYIEDVEITSLIRFEKTSGNTNAAGIKFKIFEPYTMGMFFHAIQAAANNVGQKAYNTAPFLLTLQFKGHINADNLGISGDSLSNIEKTTRHFPIKLATIDMRVGASGSEYSITALPYNQLGMSSSYTQLTTDVSISGKTVHELLQTGNKSLQRVLNERLQKIADDRGLKQRDAILIYFPNDISSGSPAGKIVDEFSKLTATINPFSAANSPDIKKKLKISMQDGGNGTLVQNVSDINALGKSSMSFDAYHGSSTPFPDDNFVYDSKKNIYSRGNMTVDPNHGDMKFTQNSNIVNVINQVLVMSDYGRQALTESQVTQSGKIVWWRVESQVYIIPSDDNLEVTGMKPKLIVYRVIPYKVCTSNFLPPGKVNPKIEGAKKQAVRQYDYLYTGLNTDVIKFDIYFKNAFYVALNSNTSTNSGDVAAGDKNATLAKEPEKVTEESKKEETIAGRLFSDLKDKIHDIAPELRFDKTTSANSDKGGSGLNNKHTLIAKQAHDIIVSNGKDMINPEMQIVGDPYYIADSGVGNYTSKPTQYENINADHSMDYQTGEVDIIVNFRTPLDIDMQLGKYDFGSPEVLKPFNGLYMVTKVVSNFSKGKFTQDLSLTRRDGQS